MSFFIFVIDNTLSQENLSNTGIASPPAGIGRRSSVLGGDDLSRYLPTINYVQPAELLHAATENVTSAELHFAEEELKNSNKSRDKYTKNVQSKIKQEVAKYAVENGTINALKKLSRSTRCMILKDKREIVGKIDFRKQRI